MCIFNFFFYLECREYAMKQFLTLMKINEEITNVTLFHFFLRLLGCNKVHYYSFFIKNYFFYGSS